MTMTAQNQRSDRRGGIGVRFCLFSLLDDLGRLVESGRPLSGDLFARIEACAFGLASRFAYGSSDDIFLTNDPEPFPSTNRLPVNGL